MHYCRKVSIRAQFNIDCVVSESGFYVYGIQEECYDLFKGEIKPYWYLFNPNLDNDVLNKVLKCVKDSVVSCDIKLGQFIAKLNLMNLETFIRSIFQIEWAQISQSII